MWPPHCCTAQPGSLYPCQAKPGAEAIKTALAPALPCYLLQALQGSAKPHPHAAPSLPCSAGAAEAPPDHGAQPAAHGVHSGLRDADRPGKRLWLGCNILGFESCGLRKPAFVAGARTILCTAAVAPASHLQCAHPTHLCQSLPSPTTPHICAVPVLGPHQEVRSERLSCGQCAGDGAGAGPAAVAAELQDAAHACQLSRERGARTNTRQPGPVGSLQAMIGLTGPCRLGGTASGSQQNLFMPG